MQPKIIAIVAMGKKSRAICKGSDLLWVLPKDHKNLREKTFGHTLIMGRKTFESIGHPLRGRANIILTRNQEYKPEIGDEYKNDPVFVVHTPEEALKKAGEVEAYREERKIFIFGGGEIYRLMMKFTDEIYATLIDSAKKGTDYFPEFEADFEIKSEKEDVDVDKLSGKKVHFSWVDLVRLDKSRFETPRHHEKVPNFVS